MSETRDTQQVLGEITFDAFTRPWPGRNGPRNAQVLAGVLRYAWQRRSLTIAVGLMEFGAEIGIASYEAIRNALVQLEAEGVLRFDLGQQDNWKLGGELGKPSHITLHPLVAPTGTDSPESLPLPTLDMFQYDELGSAGYLALARIMMEPYTERSYESLVGISDIVRLTGMTKSRVIRLMAELPPIQRTVAVGC